MKSKLLATAAALAVAAPAFAQGVVSEVNGLTGSLNGQLNLGDITATLDSTVTDAGDDVSATAAGIGNSLSATVDTANAAILGNRALQGNAGNVTATLNGTITDVEGEVSATSAAIGNSASLAASSANGAVLSAIGQGNRGNISATASVAVTAAEDAVSATSAAIGNSISIVNGVTE